MSLKTKICTGPCKQRKLIGEFWKDAQQLDGRTTRCTECIKDAREEKQARREAGEIVPRYSDEELRRRSERAKELHAQGRLGGSEFGKLGPLKRKQRITDTVLEHFRQPGQVERVVSAYERGLRSRSQVHRQKAADALVAMEIKDEEVRAKLRGAGKGPDEMTAEELEEFLVQSMTAMIERGELPIDLPADAIHEITS